MNRYPEKMQNEKPLEVLQSLIIMLYGTDPEKGFIMQEQGVDEKLSLHRQS
jgi:hypothetical protein